MKFTDHIKQHSPILLDGAMGTLLADRGYELPAPVWSAKVLEEEPEVITNIHREYLEAGAEMLTTVTFRTSEYVYEKAGKPTLAKELNHRAVQCARDAIGDRKNRFIAGSVAPVEDCYRPDLVPDNEILYEEHLKQAIWLAEAGVDCLIFETMNTIREAEVCGRAGRETGLPFFVAFIAESAKELLSGEMIGPALESVADYQPTGVLINCTKPQVITSILSEFSNKITVSLGGYANMGHSEPEQGGSIDSIFSPGEYVSEVSRWPVDDLVLIGGCCGSEPAHIRSLSHLLGKSG